MFEEQLINNRAQDVVNRGLPRVQEWSILGGMLRRHTNGRLDIFCMKEIDTDFIYMVGFVLFITGCLLAYAAAMS